MHRTRYMIDMVPALNDALTGIWSALADVVSSVLGEQWRKVRQPGTVTTWLSEPTMLRAAFLAFSAIGVLLFSLKLGHLQFQTNNIRRIQKLESDKSLTWFDSKALSIIIAAALSLFSLFVTFWVAYYGIFPLIGVIRR